MGHQVGLLTRSMTFPMTLKWEYHFLVWSSMLRREPSPKLVDYLSGLITPRRPPASSSL